MNLEEAELGEVAEGWCCDYAGCGGHDGRAALVHEVSSGRGPRGDRCQGMVCEINPDFGEVLVRGRWPSFVGEVNSDCRAGAWWGPQCLGHDAAAVFVLMSDLRQPPIVRAVPGCVSTVPLNRGGVRRSAGYAGPGAAGRRAQWSCWDSAPVDHASA